jgi:hypothetical protein
MWSCKAGIMCLIMLIYVTLKTLIKHYKTSPAKATTKKQEIEPSQTLREDGAAALRAARSTALLLLPSTPSPAFSFVLSSLLFSSLSSLCCFALWFACPFSVPHASLFALLFHLYFSPIRFFSSPILFSLSLLLLLSLLSCSLLVLCSALLPSSLPLVLPSFLFH